MRSEKAIISTTFPVLMSAKKTGWDYYTSEFNNIYRAINCNLFLSEYQYREIYKTVQGIHSYTRKFSGADDLQDFFFEANENLHYYTFAFSEDGKRCKII